MFNTVLFQQSLVRSVVTSAFKLPIGHPQWFNPAVSSAPCSCLLFPPAVRWGRGSEKREDLLVEVMTVNRTEREKKIITVEEYTKQVMQLLTDQCPAGL